ncbi:hypothetical protein AAG570_003912 [Ranatra chinensis]|uniref:Conserved oligomeric Golgi complex subunit 1 n=1 Tax=Ranatra chinensis TaxID=642074 RepID=A0ABD0Y304_9HEMI
MPGLQVLEVEPDKLFEKYTVSEIESLQKSINDEIERKREELRTLVGERYRDLIEAADTIADMKILSEQVIGDVECMNTALAQLQKKHCVRQPTTVSKPSRAVGSNCTVEDEIAAQIKLLVDLPEFAWNCIESGDYVTAAQLFLLARHVKTGFSVDKALKDVSSNLTVLEQLWSMISHFPATILKAVEADLLKTDLCPKETCSCLVGTALLENSSLVSKYLSVRSRALTETLTKTDDVRSGILSSHSVVVNTMYSLQHCFIGILFHVFKFMT